MDTRIDKIVNQVFIEKSLHDFYCSLDSCKGWEKNVIEQPKAVKKIIDSGAERIAAGIGIGSEIGDIGLARMIDHTLLKPEATSNDIIKLCEEAKRYTFASVCVNPYYVSLCHSILKDTPVKVCTVIGFPLGANTTETKKFEAEQAIQNGAGEIDMVINIGKLKEGDYKAVFEDVNKVVLTAKKHDVVCKVILETALLTDAEKIKACLICKEAKADFVKTSTGFSKGGATAADIALMKYVVGSSVGVKASGGVRTYEDAALLIESGADRIGASASVKIVNKETNNDKGY